MRFAGVGRLLWPDCSLPAPPPTMSIQQGFFLPSTVIIMIQSHLKQKNVMEFLHFRAVASLLLASHMAVFHNLQLSRDSFYFMLCLMHFSSTSKALRDHQCADTDSPVQSGYNGEFLSFACVLDMSRPQHPSFVPLG